MADGSKKRSARGLAKASEETRRTVAQMGGRAYHEKRGAKGSDSTTRRPGG